MKSEQLGDGRWSHTFRQSTLNESGLCLERARYNMAGLMPIEETGDTAYGTAAHLGMEQCIVEVLAGQGPLGLDSMIEVALAEFETLQALPHFKWQKLKQKGAEKHIRAALESWYKYVLPGLNPTFAEQKFGPILFHQDDLRDIYVTGMIDCAESNKLIDWKMSGRDNKFQRWELQRWAVQPTLYTWAAQHELYLTPARFPQPGQAEYDFEYVVFVRNKAEPQRITVTRSAADWDWLKSKCVTLAELIEVGLKSWPKSDQGWWCSPKWCGAWDRCKGASYARVEWKQ